MSLAQKHLLLSIEYKESPMPKQTSVLGMSNLSRFSLPSHLCICLLKSADRALYTLCGLLLLP